jgi:hypothetical protein
MAGQGKIKILWLFFTAYFVVASLGLPLHKHYCLGDLKKIQLFIQPESCHASDAKQGIANCCSGIHNKIKEKDKTCSGKKGKCCSDKFVYCKIDITSVNQISQISKIKELPVYSGNNFSSILVFTGFKNLIYFKSTDIFHKKIPGHRTTLALHQQFIC